jgi:hypothetical protein
MLFSGAEGSPNRALDKKLLSAQYISTIVTVPGKDQRLETGCECISGKISSLLPLAF